MRVTNDGLFFDGAGIIHFFLLPVINIREQSPKHAIFRLGVLV
jgi:hypothetical protein